MPICHFLQTANSNLSPISHRFRDTANFLVQTHIFQPLPFNPKFENVPLALNRWNFACLSLRHEANYLCKKFSYHLSFSHNASVTDDDGQRTDDTSCHRRLYSIPLTRRKRRCSLVHSLCLTESLTTSWPRATELLQRNHTFNCISHRQQIGLQSRYKSICAHAAQMNHFLPECLLDVKWLVLNYTNNLLYIDLLSTVLINRFGCITNCHYTLIVTLNISYRVPH